MARTGGEILTWSECDDQIKAFLWESGLGNAGVRCLGWIAWTMFTDDNDGDEFSLDRRGLGERLAMVGPERHGVLKRLFDTPRIVLDGTETPSQRRDVIGFRTPEIFHFCLVEHVVASMPDRMEFGLGSDARSRAVMEGRFPYFLRRRANAIDPELIEHMLCGPGTSAEDRLLGFFLVEDLPGTVEIL